MNAIELDNFCTKIMVGISTSKRNGKTSLITETDFDFPAELRSFLEGRGYQVIDLGENVKYHQIMIFWNDRRSIFQH